MHLLRNKHIFIFKYLLLFIILAVSPRPCDASGLAPSSSEQDGLTQNFSSPPLRVSVDFSKKMMTIAESLIVTISAHLPEDFELVLPEFQAALGDFAIKDRSNPTKELKDNGLVISKTWEIEPFLPGEYSIPSFDISAKNSADPKEIHSVSTDAVIIPVISFLDSEAQNEKLTDILPPISIPDNKTGLFIASGLLLLVSGACLFFFLKRRSPQKKELAVPCHIEALTAIEALTRGNLSKKGLHKEFFNCLSLILRHYIERRFFLNATEQTTEEFFATLKGTTLFNQEQKNSLRHFLSRSDLIKFAEATPSEGEIDQSLALCRSFIKQTSAQPPDEKISNNGGKL